MSQDTLNSQQLNVITLDIGKLGTYSVTLTNTQLY